MSKITELFESKAFVTGLLATAAAAGAVLGFNVPVTLILGILTPLMIAIGAQGWSDAVKMKAKMQLEHETKMYALMHGNRTVDGVTYDAEGRCPPPRTGNAQSGFAKIGVMAIITGVLGAGLLALSLVTPNSGCATVKPIADDVIHCAKAEAAAVGSGYSIVQIALDVYAAVQQGPAGIEAAVETLIKKYGGDIIACTLDSLPEPAPATGSGSGALMSASPPVLAKHQALEKFFAGKKIDHSSQK